ncbi:MAG: hypothetical protein VW840_18415 [Gammaproteobacteria bacterium]
MTHPLTDEMISKILGQGNSTFEDDMRAAYDVAASKAKIQASAILDAIFDYDNGEIERQDFMQWLYDYVSTMHSTTLDPVDLVLTLHQFYSIVEEEDRPSPAKL